MLLIGAVWKAARETRDLVHSLRSTVSTERREAENFYLVLQGSRLLPRPLCFQEAQGALGGHPCPACHPAQTLLCSLHKNS